MYRALIWIVIFTSFSFSAFSQSYNLTGKVLNQKNEPLQGVSIKIEQGPGTTTDIEGRYTGFNPQAGKYRFIIEFSKKQPGTFKWFGRRFYPQNTR